MTRKRELVALLWLSFLCLVSVNVLWLFLMVPWVGMQCVTVVYHGHTHLLFGQKAGISLQWIVTQAGLSGFGIKQEYGST